MREIKFRGVTHEFSSPSWVYGDFICNSTDAPRIMDDYHDCYEPTTWLVDPETVGQFTGLCDCKGEDIYEGDIVAYGDFFQEHDVKNEYWRGVVKWSFEGARFVLDKLDFDEDVCNDELLVIGNVYDNPELLEPQNA